MTVINLDLVTIYSQIAVRFLLLLEISGCLLQSFSARSHVFCVYCRVCDYADRTVVIALLYFCLVVRKVGNCFLLKMMTCSTVIGYSSHERVSIDTCCGRNTLRPSRMWKRCICMWEPPDHRHSSVEGGHQSLIFGQHHRAYPPCYGSWTIKLSVHEFFFFFSR